MKERRPYAIKGLAVFCTVGAILLFYDTLFGSKWLIRFGGELVDALEPILYGAFMAYLLAPVVDFFERGVAPAMKERVGKKKTIPFFVTRSVSILLTWAVIGALLYLLGSVLVPELYKSVQQLISNASSYYWTVSGWIEHLLEENPSLEAWFSEQMQTVYTQLTTWVRTEALPQAQDLMQILFSPDSIVEE